LVAKIPKKLLQQFNKHCSDNETYYFQVKFYPAEIKKLAVAEDEVFVSLNSYMPCGGFDEKVKAAVFFCKNKFVRVREVTFFRHCELLPSSLRARRAWQSIGLLRRAFDSSQ